MALSFDDDKLIRLQKALIAYYRHIAKQKEAQNKKDQLRLVEETLLAWGGDEPDPAAAEAVFSNFRMPSFLKISITKQGKELREALEAINPDLVSKVKFVNPFAQAASKSKATKVEFAVPMPPSPQEPKTEEENKERKKAKLKRICSKHDQPFNILSNPALAANNILEVKDTSIGIIAEYILENPEDTKKIIAANPGARAFRSFRDDLRNDDGYYLKQLILLGDDVVRSEIRESGILDKLNDDLKSKFLSFLDYRDKYKSIADIFAAMKQLGDEKKSEEQNEKLADFLKEFIAAGKNTQNKEFYDYVAANVVKLLSLCEKNIKNKDINDLIYRLLTQDNVIEHVIENIEKIQDVKKRSQLVDDLIKLNAESKGKITVLVAKVIANNNILPVRSNKDRKKKINKLFLLIKIGVDKDEFSDIKRKLIDLKVSGRDWLALFISILSIADVDKSKESIVEKLVSHIIGMKEKEYEEEKEGKKERKNDSGIKVKIHADVVNLLAKALNKKSDDEIKSFIQRMSSSANLRYIIFNLLENKKFAENYYRFYVNLPNIEKKADLLNIIRNNWRLTNLFIKDLFNDLNRFKAFLLTSPNDRNLLAILADMAESPRIKKADPNLSLLLKLYSSFVHIASDDNKNIYDMLMNDEAAKDGRNSIYHHYVLILNALQKIDKSYLTQEFIENLRNKLKCPPGKDLAEVLKERIANMDVKYGVGSGEMVDLDEYPEKITPMKSGDILLIGDLHGNALRMLRTLMMKGVVAMSKSDYERFRDIYHELPALLEKKDILEFNKIIDRLQIKNPDILLYLIGDMLSDRGSNDYFTLKLLVKLYVGLRHKYKICKSNHDDEFLAAIDRLGTYPLKLARLQPDDATSLTNLNMMVIRGLVSKEEIKSMVEECYMPALQMITYEVSESEKSIMVNTHAGVGLDTIEEFCQKYKIPCDFSSISAFIKTIDHINAYFLEDFNNFITMQIVEIKGDAGVKLRKDNPYHAFAQNRSYEGLRRPWVINGYRVYFNHGHDNGPGSELYTKDSPWGKRAEYSVQKASEAGFEDRDGKTLLPTEYGLILRSTVDPDHVKQLSDIFNNNSDPFNIIANPLAAKINFDKISYIPPTTIAQDIIDNPGRLEIYLKPNPGADKLPGARNIRKELCAGNGNLLRQIIMKGNRTAREAITTTSVKLLESSHIDKSVAKSLLNYIKLRNKDVESIFAMFGSKSDDAGIEAFKRNFIKWGGLDSEEIKQYCASHPAQVRELCRKLAPENPLRKGLLRVLASDDLLKELLATVNQSRFYDELKTIALLNKYFGGNSVSILLHEAEKQNTHPKVKEAAIAALVSFSPSWTEFDLFLRNYNALGMTGKDWFMMVNNIINAVNCKQLTVDALRDISSVIHKDKNVLKLLMEYVATIKFEDRVKFINTLFDNGYLYNNVVQLAGELISNPSVIDKPTSSAVDLTKLIENINLVLKLNLDLGQPPKSLSKIEFDKLLTDPKTTKQKLESYHNFYLKILKASDDIDMSLLSRVFRYSTTEHMMFNNNSIFQEIQFSLGGLEVVRTPDMLHQVLTERLARIGEALDDEAKFTRLYDVWNTILDDLENLVKTNRMTEAEMQVVKDKFSTLFNSTLDPVRMAITDKDFVDKININITSAQSIKKQLDELNSIYQSYSALLAALDFLNDFGREKRKSYITDALINHIKLSISCPKEMDIYEFVNGRMARLAEVIESLSDKQDELDRLVQAGKAAAAAASKPAQPKDDAKVSTLHKTWKTFMDYLNYQVKEQKLRSAESEYITTAIDSLTRLLTAYDKKAIDAKVVTTRVKELHDSVVLPQEIMSSTVRAVREFREALLALNPNISAGDSASKKVDDDDVLTDICLGNDDPFNLFTQPLKAVENFDDLEKQNISIGRIFEFTKAYPDETVKFLKRYPGAEALRSYTGSLRFNIRNIRKEFCEHPEYLFDFIVNGTQAHRKAIIKSEIYASKHMTESTRGQMVLLLKLMGEKVDKKLDVVARSGSVSGAFLSHFETDKITDDASILFYCITRPMDAIQLYERLPATSTARGKIGLIMQDIQVASAMLGNVEAQIRGDSSAPKVGLQEVINFCLKNNHKFDNILFELIVNEHNSLFEEYSWPRGLNVQQLRKEIIFHVLLGLDEKELIGNDNSKIARIAQADKGFYKAARGIGGEEWVQKISSLIDSGKTSDAIRLVNVLMAYRYEGDKQNVIDFLHSPDSSKNKAMHKFIAKLRSIKDQDTSGDVSKLIAGVTKMAATVASIETPVAQPAAQPSTIQPAPVVLPGNIKETPHLIEMKEIFKSAVKRGAKNNVFSGAEKSGNSENIMFLNDYILLYLREKNSDELKELYITIYNKYLKAGSPEQINLSAKLRTACDEVFSDYDPVKAKNVLCQAGNEISGLILRDMTRADLKIALPGLYEIREGLSDEKSVKAATEAFKKGRTELGKPSKVLDIDEVIESASKDLKGKNVIFNLLEIFDDKNKYQSILKEAQAKKTDDSIMFIKVLKEFLDKPSKELFRDIYDNFMGDDSKNQINLDGPVREACDAVYIEFNMKTAIRAMLLAADQVAHMVEAQMYTFPELDKHYQEHLKGKVSEVEARAAAKESKPKKEKSSVSKTFATLFTRKKSSSKQADKKSESKGKSNGGGAPPTPTQ